VGFALVLGPDPITTVASAAIIAACLSGVVFVLLTPYVLLRKGRVLKPGPLDDVALGLTKYFGLMWKWALALLGICFLIFVGLGLFFSLVNWLETHP